MLFDEIKEAGERRATKEYRVFPITQSKLLEDGCELPDEEEAETGKTASPLIKVTQYLGNKWGGKYLRAPDIYWTILEKGKGKLVRYHQSIKREVNQVPYELPGQLERAIANFVEYYNFHRYHKALGNVTPADVIQGRREQILQRRKEVQIQTINRRRDYNQGLRELINAT